MGGEEKNGESESERERERDIVGSLSVCVGHMIRARVCARARVRMFVHWFDCLQRR